MKQIARIHTEDTLRTGAAQHKTRGAWLKADSAAYQAAKHRGILDKVCAHMPASRRCTREQGARVLAPRVTYTREQLAASADKYHSRSAWSTKEGKLYRAAQNMGLMEELCRHMVPPGTKTKTRADAGVQRIDLQRYSDDEIKVSAAKYKTRSEWMKAERPLYTAAQRRGLLLTVAAHQEVLDPATSMLVYGYEFPDRSAYVGATSSLIARALAHGFKGVIRRTSKELRLEVPPTPKVLQEKIPLVDVKEAEGRWQAKYISDGWRPLWKAKPGGVGPLTRMMRHLTFGANRKVWVITGISGIGKTWVLRRLQESGVKFYHLDFDGRGWSDAYTTGLAEATRQPLPIVFDPVTNAGALFNNCKMLDYRFFVVHEEGEALQRRLAHRGLSAAPRVLSRARHLVRQAGRYMGTIGTSAQALEWLKVELTATGVSRSAGGLS